MEQPSTNEKPLISVITVNRNNMSGLEETIHSVVSQNYPAMEFVVIDGASTDGSVDILKNHADDIQIWISEPDTGIYHAMNKGIARASGEYLLFLNSGDRFLHAAVLERVSRHIAALKFPDMVHGNVLVLSTRGEAPRIKGIPRPDGFFLYVDAFHHQSMFIRRSVFLEYGSYSEDFPVMADHEYTLRVLYPAGCSMTYMPEMVSLFWHGEGASSSPESCARMSAERRRLQKQYFTVWNRCWYSFLYFLHTVRLRGALLCNRLCHRSEPGERG